MRDAETSEKTQREEVSIFVKNEIALYRPGKELTSILCEKLSFPNPKWEENLKYNRYQGDTEPVVECFRFQGPWLFLPRGFIRHLVWTCRKQGFNVSYEDQRRELPAVEFDFKGELRPYQREAVSKMLQRDFATLVSAPGSGKTVMALALVAARRQPALVVVHRRELKQQWMERISHFLNIPMEEIGEISGRRKVVGPRITVAMVQSLAKCAAEVECKVGHLVVDEAHHAPSATFTRVVSEFGSKFCTGLTASPYRRDGLSRLMYWYVGDVHHEIDPARLEREKVILQPRVLWRQTNFRTKLDASEDYSYVLQELVQDEPRNRQIVDDVLEETRRDARGVILVLSDRRRHCTRVQEMLGAKGVRAEVLTGRTPVQMRESIVHEMNTTETPLVVCATTAILGEGFDSSKIRTLVLTMPIRFEGRLLQIAGRVQRVEKDKDPRIIDYIDRHVGVLFASAQARRRAYAGWGFTQEG